MQAQGDVLIWSADLAHGGSKNPRADVTRRSPRHSLLPDELPGDR
jgi:ectoine hydroxylase-related dioxygenase (phytanoyl-CoA dioxygenase family)